MVRREDRSEQPAPQVALACPMAPMAVRPLGGQGSRTAVHRVGLPPRRSAARLTIHGSLALVTGAGGRPALALPHPWPSPALQRVLGDQAASGTGGNTPELRDASRAGLARLLATKQNIS